MLLQGTLATIKHSYEKVRLIAGLIKGNNSLFVPMVIIMSNGNSEMKDRLILGHKFTISERVVSGQVCVNMAHSVYMAFHFSQWLPQAKWRCSFCRQGEERTWQEAGSWMRLSSSFTLWVGHHQSLTQEEPSWSSWAGSKLESSVVHSTEHEPLFRPRNLLAKTEVLVLAECPTWCLSAPPRYY